MASVLKVPESTINDTASPDTIENWDSLKQINLLTALEEEFEIEFEEEQLPEMLNFKLICLAVQKHVPN